MKEKSQTLKSYLRRDFRTGTLRFSEWDGLWKSSPDDDDVGRDEYEQVYGELDRFCRKTYRHSPQYVKDFYIRGDFAGDRTQVLEINNPDILDLKFVREIQKWLLDYGHNTWRVVIPTYLTKKEVIMIYPSSIRISAKYETSLAKEIRTIASKMRKF
jgi:hypothetical protein